MSAGYLFPLTSFYSSNRLRRMPAAPLKQETKEAPGHSLLLYACSLPQPAKNIHILPLIYSFGSTGSISMCRHVYTYMYAQTRVYMYQLYHVCTHVYIPTTTPCICTHTYVYPPEPFQCYCSLRVTKAICFLIRVSH